jgi:hypothetical protein
MRTKVRLFFVAVTVATIAAVLVGPQSPAAAAGARVEAESIPQPASCWSELSWGSLSGGRGRLCYGDAAPLTWTVSGSGASNVVRLHGYRDGNARNFRVRINGGPWSTGTLTGAAAPAALFFTSPSLPSGSHRFELEWQSGGGGFTFDFYEVETADTPPTAVPTTPTDGPPGNLCRISPADDHGAITAAIAACPDGSIVQFPAGAVYHQNAPIDVINRSNLVIDGGGSRFLNSAPNVSEVRPNWRVVWARNVTLRNMTAVGNFTLSGPRSLPTVSAIAPNQWNSGFWILGGDGVTIADVTVRDTFGDFVTTAPAFFHGGGSRYGEIPRNVRVIRLDGTRAARHCIAPTTAIGFWLEDSTLRDCWYGGVDAEVDAPGLTLHDVHILRNTFDGYYLFAVAVPFAGHGGDVNGIEIRANKTLTPGDTCWPTILVGGRADDPSAFLNIAVTDNQLKTLATGISVERVNTGSITNNAIEKTAPSSLCGPPAPVPLAVRLSTAVAQWGNTTLGYE